MTTRSPSLLLIHEQDRQGRHRILVRGHLDLEHAERLLTVGSRVLQPGRVQLVLDLQGVDHMDSTGLAVLLSLLRRAKARHGALLLSRCPKAVTRLLALTGVDRLIPIERPAAPT